MRNDICKTYIEKRAIEDKDPQAMLILEHVSTNANAQLSDKITNEELRIALRDSLKILKKAFGYNEQNRDSGNWSEEVDEELTQINDKLLDILAGI